MIANFQFLIVIFHIVSCVWDAIHLYIANNIDWMEEWIEWCLELYGTLSWAAMSKLIKTVHRHRWEYLGELTQREIDLACGLNDKKEIIFYTLITFFVVSHYINVFILFIYSYIFIYWVKYDAIGTPQGYVVQWF